MSIPFLDRIFENWHNPDYEGFSEVLPRTNHVPTTIDLEFVQKMKLDIDQIQFLEPTIKSIDSYPKNKKGLFQFLNDRNFIQGHPREQMKAYKITGGDNPPDSDVLKKYLTMDMEYILQISFNNGGMTMDLIENTKAYIVTHSSYKFEYSWYSKMFMDYNFPNRHMFHMGIDENTIKLQSFSTPQIKYDLIVYAGSRQYKDVYNIIKECKNWSHPETVIYITAVAPHRGWGHGPYVAMNKLLKDGIVYFVEHVKATGYYGDYTNGMAILKYKFDNASQTDPNSPIYNKPLYDRIPTKILKEIEIEIPLHEFIYYIRDAKNKGIKLQLDMVIYYLKIFIKEGVPLDEWLLKDLKQEYGLTIEDDKII